MDYLERVFQVEFHLGELSQFFWTNLKASRLAASDLPLAKHLVKDLRHIYIKGDSIPSNSGIFLGSHLESPSRRLSLISLVVTGILTGGSHSQSNMSDMFQ